MTELLTLIAVIVALFLFGLWLFRQPNMRT